MRDVLHKGQKWEEGGRTDSGAGLDSLSCLCWHKGQKLVRRDENIRRRIWFMVAQTTGMDEVGQYLVSDGKLSKT